MVGNFDTPRYLQRSSICCEVLLRTESLPLEIGARYSRIHQWYLWFWHTYQRGTTVGTSLEVFAEADYASKATDRRSVSGGAIMCAGACVCWFSRTQKCVTLVDLRITVSSAWELTSVAMRYSHGDGVNTSLSRLVYCTHVWCTSV